MFRQVRRGRIPYYVFDELEGIFGLVHGFTTRHSDETLGLDDPLALKSEWLEVLDIAPGRLQLLEQIHSAKVIDCGETPKAGPLSGPADGWLLRRPGYYGVIRTADCLPVLAVAPRQGQGCALHAGWRGTRDRIAERGVRRLLETSAADPGEIVVGLGPAIRVCCYEVGDEVRREFEARGHDIGRIFHGRNLDLIESNRMQLQKLGVRRILDSGMCTVCRSDLFYSHRRDRDERRMWSLLGFREDAARGSGLGASV